MTPDNLFLVSFIFFSSLNFLKNIFGIGAIIRACIDIKILPYAGFFYGEIHISINIGIHWLQPTCMYQLRYRAVLMILVLDFHLLNLSKTASKLG